jgi:hypothetical protein
MSADKEPASPAYGDTGSEGYVMSRGVGAHAGAPKKLATKQAPGIHAAAFIRKWALKPADRQPILRRRGREVFHAR